MTAAPIPPPWPQRLIAAFNLVLALTLAVLFSLVLFLVGLLTLFQARRFYSEVCVKYFSRLLLRLGRTRWRVAGEVPAYAGQVFYMPNHPSVIDPFVLTALGLPNTRFFMSITVARRFPPIGMVSALIGVFFTPDFDDTAARIVCFRRAYEHLAGSGESVLGSPEGRITPEGQVGRFNRGVFHLATLLQAPIVPIYLVYDQGRGVGRGFALGNPEVTIHFLPPIATKGWRVEDIDTNKERVREVFLAFGRELAEGTA